MNLPKDILMVAPTHYRVENAINPHMLGPDGKLNVVDLAKANVQWSQMKSLYEDLGLRVHILEGAHDYPDFVFCANQMMPFLNDESKPSVLMGKMRSSTRQGEVPLVRKWAEKLGLQVYDSQDVTFEGCGDAIWNFHTGEIFGGFGFRTDREAYAQISEIVDAPVHMLELVDNRLYHLDTCFVVLDGERAAYVEEAFTKEGRETLKKHVPDLIRIELSEALRAFAGNAFCPDGKNVVLQKGATQFVNDLKRRGFSVHEVETGEFLKSGGSVFCTKQQFWAP